MNDKHIGSDFDDFLREEGLLEEAEAVARRVVADKDFEPVGEPQGEEKLNDSSDLLQFPVPGEQERMRSRASPRPGSERR